MGTNASFRPTITTATAPPKPPSPHHSTTDVMMIVQSTRRPLGCWKSLLRQSRQQREWMLRSMATAADTTSSSSQPTPLGGSPIPPAATPPRHKFHAIKSNNPTKPIRSAFAVYPRVPSSRESNPAALSAYHASQIRRLDRSGARTALFSKKNPDSAKPGDVLQVTTSRGEPFSGVCQVRRAGVDTAILLRNHLSRLGVEMWYKIYSPSVLGIEIIHRRPKRARRARLMFMRKPKHDMGNVDHLVEAWRRTRNVFSSKGKNAGRQSKNVRKR